MSTKVTGITGGSCLLDFACFLIYTGPGGASGIMVIIVGNGHGDISSNPGQD